VLALRRQVVLTFEGVPVFGEPANRAFPILAFRYGDIGLMMSRGRAERPPEVRIQQALLRMLTP